MSQRQIVFLYRCHRPYLKINKGQIDSPEKKSSILDLDDFVKIKSLKSINQSIVWSNKSIN